MATGSRSPSASRSRSPIPATGEPAGNKPLNARRSPSRSRSPSNPRGRDDRQSYNNSHNRVGQSNYSNQAPHRNNDQSESRFDNNNGNSLYEREDNRPKYDQPRYQSGYDADGKYNFNLKFRHRTCTKIDPALGTCNRKVCQFQPCYKTKCPDLFPCAEVKNHGRCQRKRCGFNPCCFENREDWPDDPLPVRSSNFNRRPNYNSNGNYQRRSRSPIRHNDRPPPYRSNDRYNGPPSQQGPPPSYNDYNDRPPRDSHRPYPVADRRSYSNPPVVNDVPPPADRGYYNEPPPVETRYESRGPPRYRDDPPPVMQKQYLDNGPPRSSMSYSHRGGGRGGYDNRGPPRRDQYNDRGGHGGEREMPLGREGYAAAPVHDGPVGGYDDSRGSYDGNNRGGYGGHSNRGGYDNARGGYGTNNRGGYRGRGRGGGSYERR